jgi:serine/threonine protein kinase
LGIDSRIDIDYRQVPVEPNDVFLLTTDGVHEYAQASFITRVLKDSGTALDEAAHQIGAQAYEKGSGDNLTVQIVKVLALPAPQANEMYRQISELPLAPLLQARMLFDGYEIVREVKGSSRSHIYLAIDAQTRQRVIIKTPSIDLQADPAYLERFLMEEWIARRINSPHVLKPCLQDRKRNFIYVATEFIEGQTLAQWLIDNHKPDLAAVRGIVEQIAKGLQAFHRLEMLHQDLKPDNIMIDTTGTVKIIDFGATRVAGMMEMATPIEQINLLGAAQYAAPEYFLGENGSTRSDIFSLGVIAYQMLSGKLPYGAEVPKARTRAAQRNLDYQTVLNDDREIPAWVDDAIKKAVHPDPLKRYEELSEFIYDLHHPNQAFLSKTRPPLIERNPVVFWKTVSLLLLIVIVVMAGVK